MATLRIVTAIGASATVDNILAGSKFEFPEQAVVVRIYSVVDLTDVAAGSVVQMDATKGNVLCGDDVNVGAFTDNLGPNRNEHLITRFVAAPGQRIQIKLRETGANAADVRTLIDFDEIV